jgi:hypothetical protein
VLVETSARRHLALMSSTLSRRSILVGLATLGLLGCSREPEVDSAQDTTRGDDTPEPSPTPAPAVTPAPTTDADTVTIIGPLVALGRPPRNLPGYMGVEQTLSLRVESAKGTDIATGTTVEITIALHSRVPMISGSPIPIPELDPAYFRVGRRFRIVTTLTGGRYRAKTDENAIQPMD